MSLRLIASFAGIAGTIAGAVGTSYSFLGSGLKSTNSSSRGGRKAKAQGIKSIDASFRCSKDLSRGPTGKDDFTLAWEAKDTKGQLSKLKENQEVEITGNFSFQANNDWNAFDKFFPGKAPGDVYMSVQLGNGDKLNITLGRNTSGSQLVNSDTFWCKSGSEWKILSNEGADGLITFVKMHMPDLKTLRNYEESKLKVALRNCQESGEGKTCTLQLISTYQNKNIKVFETEKFNIPK